MKRKICLLLSVLFILLAFQPFVYGQSYRRNITGEFSNIQLNINNTSIPLVREPFIYEGEVYVPIKDLSQWLYLNSQYDATNNIVKISTGDILQDANARTLAGNLLQKDYEIQVLNQQLQEKDEVLNGETGLPYKKIDSVKEMETYLQDYFGKFYGISMTIDFRHDSSYRYRLYITLPSGDSSYFNDLSRRVVEKWLDDILYTVRHLYDDSARIDGYIRDNASPYRTHVSFDTSGDRLNYSFDSSTSSSNRSNSNRIDIDEARLEKHLKKNLPTYSSVDFDYKVNANRHDIDLIVYFDDENFYDWSTTTQRNYLDRLERVLRSYDGPIDAYGKIINSDTEEEVVLFDFLDNKTDDDYTSKRPSSTIKTETKVVEQNPVVKRTVAAWFSHAGLEIDGTSFTMLKEPFMVDEEIYMPITDLGDALYWVFEYLPEESLLKITDSNFASKNYLAFGGNLLDQRDETKTKLEKDLEIKKEEMERNQKAAYPYRNILSISKMQGYLRDYFEDFEGIEMNISLSHSRDSSYRLSITYPSKVFDDFDGIKRSTIENWIEDMFDAIKELYDPYADISGSIRNTPSSKDYTYILFDTIDGKLDFDFEDHGDQGSSSQKVDTAKLEKALDKHLYRFRSVSFRYEVVANRKDVDLTITCNTDIFYRWDLEDKMDYLKDLKEEIYDVYDGISVNGRILNTGKTNEIFRFSIEKGNIRSYDLLQDMEKYLNKNYGTFDSSFDFTYKLSEKSNRLDVKLEGDFFQEENKWRDIAEDDSRLQDFEDFVVDALKYVSEFFEADVSGEAVDKAYSTLTIKTKTY
ncbi:hypothetical protein SAMN05446037_101040 [Anaerovirgula multivorans]|uniref:Copper amine oxidase N-terminal domain-containing protein n=1 Tax=Anaerovirgula multivorans TaxID=312168 RepID=A0A239EIM3_9FIRM|nr:hypothetical protein [Anaerovirgula multivorans]SNS44118.1 hypothetical protein SAMN05446037_101040 [Anaerovirgula multivorans]